MYPIKPLLLYRGGEFVEDTSKTDEELLKAYSSKGFLPYQWGVWVTAWARYELRRGQYIVGNENLLYCDTDSVKFLEDKKHYPDFSSYNEEWKKRMIYADSVFYDKDGKPHYLGQYEKEKSHEKFISLGAKKYAVQDGNKVGLTLAGVKKEAGARELESHGGITAFKEGFVFKNSAGLKATYNDETDRWITVNGEAIHLISNLYLEDTEYTLGITDDYDTIIQIAANIWMGRINKDKLLTR